MERPPPTKPRLRARCVDPPPGQISRDRETARLRGRALRLLLCLADHAGEVVSIDDLLNQAWPGVIVSPDSVYQGVASLRRVLGDDPKQPTYIETVPRLGYRLVAAVSPWADRSITATPDAPESGPRVVPVLAWAGAAICLTVVVALLIYGSVANSSPSASPA